ncbi:MAG TPA: hypothetical protein VFX16_04300 [Pseudonocardiaceae bacterium]|nr:hypothetical protein [Pseudonocardiaceae bacterium]
MPSDASRPTRWWVAPVLAVVVVATAVAALVAHSLYRRPVAVSAPSVVVATGSSSMPGSAEPGPPNVSVTPEVQRTTLYPQVLQLAQTYFDAINAKKYDEWRSVVTRAVAKTKSQSAFLKGYESTHDGSIVVYRVDGTPGAGLRVLVTFHSVQEVADTPAGSPFPCLAWQVVWPLSFDNNDGRWKIDAGTTTDSPQREAC